MSMEDIEALIERIEWYRDEYHKSEFCHNEMIERLRNNPTDAYIELCWQITDAWDWIDY